jgi:hypothetical protein
VGIAHCQRHLQGSGKLLVGLHKDSHAAFINSRPNPMVRVALDRIVDDEEALLRLISGHGTHIRPAEEGSDDST